MTKCVCASPQQKGGCSNKVTARWCTIILKFSTIKRLYMYVQKTHSIECVHCHAIENKIKNHASKFKGHVNPKLQVFLIRHKQQ